MVLLMAVIEMSYGFRMKVVSVLVWLMAVIEMSYILFQNEGGERVGVANADGCD